MLATLAESLSDGHIDEPAFRGAIFFARTVHLKS